jgi:DNA-binding beta-propeller fold protein YncE
MAFPYRQRVFSSGTLIPAGTISLMFLIAVVLSGCSRGEGTRGSMAGNAVIVLERTIPLPGVGGPADRNGIAGRLDHLAYDPSSRRLFLTTVMKGSLEVIDLDRGMLAQSIENISKAQGVAVAPFLGRLFVTSGATGTIHAYDTKTLQPIRDAFVIEDADNVRFDSRNGQVWVGGGSKTGGAVVALDPTTLAKVAEVLIPSHAESFQLDPDGQHMFINVPGDKHSEEDGVVVVADREKCAVRATWKAQGMVRNFPMAIDSAHNRVFVISRKPARITAFDARTGNVLATASCAPDSDDAFFDQKTQRLMVIAGGRRVTDSAGEPVERDQPGALEVFAVGERNEISRIASAPLPPHSRTGLFVPERRMVYVAVPIQKDGPARILEYRLAG